MPRQPAAPPTSSPRAHQIKVTLSEQERDQITANAAAELRTPAEWARLALLGHVNIPKAAPRTLARR